MRFLPYRCFLMFSLVAVVSVGCNTADERNELHEQDETVTAEDLERKTENFALTRKDNAKSHMGDLVNTIESRVKKLDRWESQGANIPEDAKLRLQELRDDLLRLKTELEYSYDSIEKVVDEGSAENQQMLENKIERSRDELEQIDEELSEWRQNNLE